jgi:2-desacetyl-2-hydroxyethyl bacteriochlorophyllide A dehydrogenase
MRAAVMRSGRIVAAEVPDPVPGAGQVLVKTLACGICGSDLHALKHGEQMVRISREIGAGAFVMDLSRDVVMGHEFCAEVLDFGPGCERKFRRGDRVCSMPVMPSAAGVAGVGYSNEFPGGYGERMLLPEPLLLRVPDSLPSEAAALTEPLAVAEHAVAKGALGNGEAPLVVGCGPVGLAVIAALRRRGIEPIVASDLSPSRRAQAAKLGAHAVVDPRSEPPMERFAKEAGAKQAVIFECVGVPGMLAQLMKQAPRGGRIVVVGVCMEDDRIQPLVPISKELNLQFVLAYTPEEFAATLHALADGDFDASAFLTGRVGVDGVAGAFDALATPDRHVKILVEPWRNGLLQ